MPQQMKWVFLRVGPRQEYLKKTFNISISSVQFSLSVVSDSLRPHESQHARPPCPSPSPGVHSDSRPSSLWCHPAISSSVFPFFSCPQSLPASESFPVSQLFAWGGQSTGASASASFLPKKSQGWSPSEWTGWISLQSKGLYIAINVPLCQEPAQEIPPMTRSCREAWWARWVRPQGFPLEFPEHVPQKTGVCLLYYCAFHSSNVLWKKVNSGLQSPAYERNVSAQTPLMAL